MKSIEHYEQLAREAKGECNHIGPAGKSWGTWWRAGLVTNEDDGHVFACMWCGEVLPFGPATDAAEVLVEIRAAEIAADGIHDASLLEWAGWISYPEHAVSTGQGAAGFLARCILNHDAEQAETGGAG